MVRSFKRKKAEPRWVGPFVVLKTTAKGVEIKTAEGSSRFLTLGDVKAWKPKEHDVTDLEVPHLEVPRSTSTSDQQLGGNYVDTGPGLKLSDQDDGEVLANPPE